MLEEEVEIVEQFVRDNLAKGFITPSLFKYVSPILFIRKQNGGLRLYIDYRGLNEITKKDRYLLPLIDKTVARVIKAKFFTKFDIKAIFNNLRIATEKDYDLTTFVTKFGNYKSNVLPFGLCNRPAYFQRYINTEFMDMLDRFIAIYIDDILIYSNTKKEYIEHVKKVLQRLRELGLRVDVRKSKFNVNEVKFLGLVIIEGGVKMDPSKVSTILK